MDLQLYARVLWRFRLLVLGGLLLAVTLAFFSYVNVKFEGGKPSFSYRDSEQWESAATIGVGSNSFLAGQAVDPEVVNALKTSGQSAEKVREVLGNQNPGQFSDLDVLNAATLQLMRLALSDDVRQIMLRDGKGPILGALQTFEVQSGETMVPYINFSAVATSPAEALSLAQRHVSAFSKFLRQQQQKFGIDPDQRIVLYNVNRPEDATLLQGRKKTRPIIVFLAVMTAIVGLVFVLENLRPRVRTVPSAAEGEDADVRNRRLSA